MADVCDLSDQKEEQVMQMRVAALRNQPRTTHPIGECHWCEAPFPSDSPKLFCDKDCAMDWEKHGNQ